MASDAGLQFETIKLVWPAEHPTVLYAYLNRPAKKNAVNKLMYQEVKQLLNQVGKRDETDILVLSGTGDFYSSGNDLSGFMEVDPETIAQEVADAERNLTEFVDAWIEFPKILICAVNGPAIGIAATTLGLADFVLASDKAFIETPFIRLGQAPEGCSSLLFPRLMGARANRFLLLGERITATEAFDFGLVTAVFPAEEYGKRVAAAVAQIAALPRTNLLKSKALSRGRMIAELKQVSREEVRLNTQLWGSEELMNAVMNFFAKKSVSARL